MQTVTLYEDGAGHLALWAAGRYVEARGFVGAELAVGAGFAVDAAALLDGDVSDWTLEEIRAEPEESRTRDGWTRVAMYWRAGSESGTDILAEPGAAAARYIGPR